MPCKRSKGVCKREKESERDKNSDRKKEGDRGRERRETEVESTREDTGSLPNP